MTTTWIPFGAATNHDRIPADVFDAAMMAAFPGLPHGMSLDEAGRRIAAALNTVWPLIEQQVRERGGTVTETAADPRDGGEYVPCPRHGTRCFPEIPDLAQRIECAIGLGERGSAGVKATTERIMAMIEDHVLAELADVDDELNEARLHNDATCSAVVERDQARSRLEAVDALLTSGPVGRVSGERYIRADLIREALKEPAP